jgi:hypothetical protein
MGFSLHYFINPRSLQIHFDSHPCNIWPGFPDPEQVSSRESLKARIEFLEFAKNDFDIKFLTGEPGIRVSDPHSECDILQKDEHFFDKLLRSARFDQKTAHPVFYHFRDSSGTLKDHGKKMPRLRDCIQLAL